MIEATREHLAVARAAGSTIKSRHAITLLEGYAIGAELEEERIAVGWRRVGWKLDQPGFVGGPGIGPALPSAGLRGDACFGLHRHEG